MRMIKEFFLKQRRIAFENWQLGLLVIIAIFGVVGFGALVEFAANDPYRSNPVADASLRIARIPADTRHVVNEVFKGAHPQITRQQRFEGQAGFEIINAAGPTGGLLVLSRYDGDIGRSVVELIDVDSGDVIHKYAPDFDAINALSNLSVTEVNHARDHHAGRYMITHPEVGEDGHLAFQGMGTPFVKVDACSRIEWALDGIFHHSIERGPNGNYWVPKNLVPSSIALTSAAFSDNAIAKISPDGEVLFEKSVGQLLIDNGLEYLVYTGDDYMADPLHLNDIQPVLEDGQYWLRGDVFLSLRNRSTVILYRPSTNEVLWRKHGPWMAQHDVDIVSNHEISIFNNHTAAAPGGEYVLGSNEILIYDFESDQVRSSYSEGLRRHEVRTITDGLSEILPNGDVFVEEQNFGRILAMNSDGDIRWRYVNRASDQQVYHVQWSRYLSADTADGLRTRLANLDCESV